MKRLVWTLVTVALVGLVAIAGHQVLIAASATRGDLGTWAAGTCAACHGR